jgi:hypothetical protein
MPPGQLSNSLLDNCGIRPSLGKGAHIHQVGARKPLHVRESGAQIMRQPLDHLGPPALLGLPFQNIAPNLPVKQHQLAVYRQRRALLGGVDTGLQLRQPVGVASGGGGEGHRGIGVFAHGSSPSSMASMRCLAVSSSVLASTRSLLASALRLSISSTIWRWTVASGVRLNKRL